MTSLSIFFFFNDTATTEIYTLSLHDALPISPSSRIASGWNCRSIGPPVGRCVRGISGNAARSEEHTSELQSHSDLVCRLLLEKKKTKQLRTCLIAARQFSSAGDILTDILRPS